jgi:hypothetical protein
MESAPVLEGVLIPLWCPVTFRRASGVGRSPLQVTWHTVPRRVRARHRGVPFTNIRRPVKVGGNFRETH